MKVLAVDKNHPILIERLRNAGFIVDVDYSSPKHKIEDIISQYNGLIIRSRFPIDKEFLDKATDLQFIGRVGAGLENIDVEYAQKKHIKLYNAPEGNRDAVGEHTLGMLLSIMNKFVKSDDEVRKGIWEREGNRGEEIGGKTIALIGYGNMGKAFAKRLKGFDANVIFHDIKPNLGDENATQVDLNQIFEQADVLSLHTPLTPLTKNMVNAEYISKFKKPFYFVNTARGKSVVTNDLVAALKSGKVKAAALDVLEYEKSSFEDLFKEDFPQALQYLIKAENVLLTPHIAGWTVESKFKLANVIADKILSDFG